jgi:2-C-methyl-D-erythritol 4-phosphate cytidylyltransferase
MGSDLPKQYLELAGATVLEHSLLALLASDRIAGVVVALHPRDERAAQLSVMNDPRIHTTEGGEQRSDSVLAGLDALAPLAGESDWVLVHDAARPCLSQADLENLIDRVLGDGVGGILAEPVVDTVKLADANGLVQRTLDRDSLWRAQTPQMFRLDALRNALQAASEQGQAVTDEASAMELAGEPVQLVAASPHNLKVTVAADLELAALYLAREQTGE